jgi:RNA polymerase sigma-70 factor (ECF subfamily)
MPERGVQTIMESPALAGLSRRLYESGNGSQFGLTVEAFQQILQEITAKYLSTDVDSNEIKALWEGLRVEELILARSCAAGNERAWEVFLSRYRIKLYDIAAFITKETASARELADSIYADLYGTSTREGQRVSKLASYTGRGSLEGWLRTVMAQEFVNRYRRQKRLVSLDEEEEDGSQFQAAEAEPVAVVDARLEAATDEALGELSAQDRFVLASYFLDSRTLAEIARTLGVHESTISRKVDKLAKSLRKRILGGLVRRGMSRRQAEEAMEIDVRDLGLDIKRRLLQENGETAFPDKKAEARASER